MAQFGSKFDAQGVLAGSRESSRCIGYLTKYLTKHLGDCRQSPLITRPRMPDGSPTRCTTSRAQPALPGARRVR